MLPRKLHLWDEVPKVTACALSLYLLFFGTSARASPPPVITVQPVSQTVLLNDSATFTVAASSGTALTYQWLKNGGNISGATISSYTITNAQAGDQAVYAAKVTNAGGTVTSANATLTVLVPAQIATQPASQTVVLGQQALFSVEAFGDAPLSYQWTFNGAPLAGATNSTLTRNNVQASDAGNYLVVVSNAGGSIISDAASLVVTNPLSITPPLLSSAAMTSNGFFFQFSVTIGSTYVVLASTNVRDWTPIYTNVALTASGAFTDTAAKAFGRRFYRMVLR